MNNYPYPTQDDFRPHKSQSSYLKVLMDVRDKSAQRSKPEGHKKDTTKKDHPQASTGPPLDNINRENRQ